MLGDDQLNEVKLKNYFEADRVFPCTPETVRKLKLPAGSIGPLGLESRVEILFDHAVDLTASYVVGAMEKGYHYKNYIPKRDSNDIITTDLRISQAGDLCKSTGGTVSIKRGIEVGHIFQLGNSYSKAMNAFVQDRHGNKWPPLWAVTALVLVERSRPVSNKTR